MIVVPPCQDFRAVLLGFTTRVDKPFGNCSQVGFKMREEGPSLFEITG